MLAIETKGLSKTYKKLFSFQQLVAVDQVDLEVPTGAIFGFLGLNGAGKTTTIKMLLGLAYPSSGGGSVLGKPLGNIEAKEKIGFLPEEAYFQRHLDATEFLNFCGKTLHMSAEKRKERIVELLELVGMSNKAQTKLNQFSKGMLQRVGVAQALLNDPDLIIFDEPLTGLDPKGRSQLKEIMKGLQKMGKTVFFSSHILSDVQEICDHTAILNRGQLIYQGKINDLVDVESYELKVEDVGVDVLNQMDILCSGMRKEGSYWVFKFSERKEQKEGLALLQKNDLKVIEQSLSYKELEPVFLQKIDEDNSKRGLT